GPASVRSIAPGMPPGERDPSPYGIDRHEADTDGVAKVDDLGGRRDAVVGARADVDEPFYSRADPGERSVGHDPRDRRLDGLAEPQLAHRTGPRVLGKLLDR